MRSDHISIELPACHRRTGLLGAGSVQKGNEDATDGLVLLVLRSTRPPGNNNGFHSAVRVAFVRHVL